MLVTLRESNINGRKTESTFHFYRNLQVIFLFKKNIWKKKREFSWWWKESSFDSKKHKRLADALIAKRKGLVTELVASNAVLSECYIFHYFVVTGKKCVCFFSIEAQLRPLLQASSGQRHQSSRPFYFILFSAFLKKEIRNDEWPSRIVLRTKTTRFSLLPPSQVLPFPSYINNNIHPHIPQIKYKQYVSLLLFFKRPRSLLLVHAILLGPRRLRRGHGPSTFWRVTRSPNYLLPFSLVPQHTPSPSPSLMSWKTSKAKLKGSGDRV